MARIPQAGRTQEQLADKLHASEVAICGEPGLILTHLGHCPCMVQLILAFVADFKVKPKGSNGFNGLMSR